MINLCKQFGVLVIAEGVETIEQYQWLQAHGCEYVQGFLVGAAIDGRGRRQLRRSRSTGARCPAEFATLAHLFEPCCPSMTALKYLQAYPAHLQDQVRQLIAEGRLGDYLNSVIRSGMRCRATRRCTATRWTLKQEYLRNAPAIDKVLFDNRLDLTHRALGLHTTVSRVQGGKLKAKKEIRIASLFKDAAPEFLKMIVVHELAHFKESDHNKAFYKLCEHMLPGYHQVEFDLRVYLTWRDMQGKAADRNQEGGGWMSARPRAVFIAACTWRI